MTSSMSEHTMPAPIASTATTAAPACTDCLPAPSTSTSTSTSVAPPPDVAHQQAARVDPSTFDPPALGSSEGEVPRVVIEFCDRCRWLHRATWTQTELFLTFPPSVNAPSEETSKAPAPAAPGLRSISLVPRNAPETGGRFRVWLLLGDSAANDVQGPYPTGNKGKERWRGWELVWDRKIEGRFPEMKELKQRIRNLIAPSQNLGHSDKPVASTASSVQPPIPAAGPKTTPANTAAEVQKAAAPVAPTEPAEAMDLSTLAEQPLKPLTEADFAPRYRCM